MFLRSFDIESYVSSELFTLIRWIVNALDRRIADKLHLSCSKLALRSTNLEARAVLGRTPKQLAWELSSCEGLKRPDLGIVIALWKLASWIYHRKDELFKSCVVGFQSAK